MFSLFTNFNSHNMKASNEVEIISAGVEVESKILKGDVSLAHESYTHSKANDQYSCNYNTQLIFFNNMLDPKTNMRGAPFFLSLDLIGEYSLTSGFRNRGIGATFQYEEITPGNDIVRFSLSSGLKTDYANNNLDHFFVGGKFTITENTNPVRQVAAKMRL